METVSKFSSVCGDNIEISEDCATATWTPKKSGGWAYCDSDFHPGETVNVKVEGSGRCDIGFLKGDQNTWSPSAFKTLNEIRAHRRTCDIPITFDTDGEEVSSQFSNKKFKKRVQKGEKIRIAVIILYGEMSAEIYSDESSENSKRCPKFADSPGPNIQLENDNSKVSSIQRNPGSICLLADKLMVGNAINVLCGPTKEGVREPGRYSLKLLVSDRNPEDLKSNEPFLFDVNRRHSDNDALKKIENLEKDECNGNIVITLSSDGVLQYTSAKNKKNQQRMSVPTEQGIWIVFDLYRVSVCVTQGAEGFGSDTVHGEKCSLVGLDIPDSVPMSPRSEETVELHSRIKKLETIVSSLQVSNGALCVPPESAPSPAATSPGTEVPTNTTTADEPTGEVFNIQRNFRRLVMELDPMAFADHLYEKSIITQEQMETIQAKEKANGNREMLKLMSKVTVKIRKEDIDYILKELGQRHLLPSFYPRQT